MLQVALVTYEHMNRGLLGPLLAAVLWHPSNSVRDQTSIALEAAASSPKCYVTWDGVLLAFHIFPLYFLFWVISLVDILREMRKTLDLCVFATSIGLLTCSLCCGAVMDGIMNAARCVVESMLALNVHPERKLSTGCHPDIDPDLRLRGRRT